MFPRIVYESFRRQARRKLLAGIAITLGVAVATAMIAVATDIGDKINRELRSYGANLVVTPQEDTLDVEVGGVNLKPPSDGAFLNEADLPKIRGTFWHHNIVGFSPMLPVTVKVGGSAKDVTLVGTYFDKPLHFRQGRLHDRRADHASLVEGFVGTGALAKSLASLQQLKPAKTTLEDGFLPGERLAAEARRNKPGDHNLMRLRPPIDHLRHTLHRRSRGRPDRRAACPRAANSWQTRRCAPRLRQRADQASGCACHPRS